MERLGWGALRSDETTRQGPEQQPNAAGGKSACAARMRALGNRSDRQVTSRNIADQDPHRVVEEVRRRGHPGQHEADPHGIVVARNSIAGLSDMPPPWPSKCRR